MHSAERQPLAPAERRHLQALQQWLLRSGSTGAAPTLAGDDADRVPYAAESCSPAMVLPFELLVRILTHVDYSTLLACRGVCRAWLALLEQHSALWTSACVGKPSDTRTFTKAEQIRRQTRTLEWLLAQSGTALRRLSLCAPLSDAHDAMRLSQRLSMLTCLYIRCAHASAARWFDAAVRLPSLTDLVVVCKPEEMQHPWDREWDAEQLGSTDEALPTRLRRLELRGTPSLAPSGAVLQLCSELHTFTYHDGARQALRPPDARAAEFRTVCAVLGTACATLAGVVLPYGSLWQPLLDDAETYAMPALRQLEAPLRLAQKMEAPSLEQLTCNMTTQDRGAACALAQRTRSLRALSLHLDSAADTRLALELLGTWDALEVLHVYVQEEVVCAPALETRSAAFGRPLTAELLVRLLTPGELCDAVLCPRLHTLRIERDATLRGGELLEMVAVRRGLACGLSVAAARAAKEGGAAASPPEATAHAAPCCSLDELDVDQCVGLAPRVVPYLERHVARVLWNPASVLRERMAHDRRRTPQTYRARVSM